MFGERAQPGLQARLSHLPWPRDPHLYKEGWDQVTFEAFSLKLYDSMNILSGARKVAKEQLLVDR